MPRAWRSATMEMGEKSAATRMCLNCSIYRPLRLRRSSSEKDPGIVGRRGSKFACPGPLVQLPWRCSGFAGSNHLVRVNIRAHRILRKLRRVPQMLARCPTVPIIIDIQFDAVAIGILIVQSSLRASVGTQNRRDAFLLQPHVGAEQIVKTSIFEGKVLQPGMMRSVGISFKTGQFDECEAMVRLIIGQPRRFKN